MMKNSHTIPVVIGLLVVVYIALLTWKTNANRQMQRSAIAAHQADVVRCMELGYDINERIKAAGKARISRTQFIEQFGQISTCSSKTDTEAPPNATHVLIHEPSHRVFYLRFDGDALMGWNSSYGPGDILSHLPSIEQRIEKMK